MSRKLRINPYGLTETSCTAEEKNPIYSLCQSRHCSFERLENRELLAVVTAVQDGPWSDAATWGGVGIPTATDFVTIENGITVTYDLPVDNDPTAEAAEVIVRTGGQLYFSRVQSTRLDLDGSLSVMEGGILDVGRPTDPIPAGQTAFIGFNVPDDQLFSSNDPSDPNFQVGPIPAMPDYHPEDIGIWVLGSNSSATFNGTTKETWTRLAQDAGAGTIQLVLSDTPQGWRIGDQIVITPSGHNALEVETRTITAITGNQITVDQAVTHLHEGRLFAYDPATQLTRPIANESELAGNEKLIRNQAEVGLLTQNVTVASNLVTAGDTNHRAHTAYMGGATGSISYTEFRDLGPRGKLGRYPIHFHKLGVPSPGERFQVEGASIWQSTSDPGNKFLVMHSTDEVIVKDSVGLNAQGAGFYTESGNERSNRLEDNLGILVYGPEELPGTPAGAFSYPETASAVFWGREGNEFINNVAVAGVAGTAGFWLTPNLSDISNSPTLYQGNESHTNDIGLYYSGGSSLNLQFEGGNLWHNQVGLRATTLPVQTQTIDTLFFGNTQQYTAPFPGSSSNNVFLEDNIINPPWQGFIDKYVELNTELYTFGPEGVGNINYYDGDFGDYDGDGLIDRAIIARYGILRNTGDGYLVPVAGQPGFGEAPRQNLTGFKFREAPDNNIGLGDDSINFADIDNDGDLDVLSGGNGEIFAIQENQGGRFSIKQTFNISSWQITNTDLEGDGDVDFIVTSNSPRDFAVLVNDGSGYFTNMTTSINTGFSPLDPSEGQVSGDIDGDGDYDILLIDGENKVSPEIGLVTARNDGQGNFSTEFTPFANGFDGLTGISLKGTATKGMLLGDIDNDGDLDLVMGHRFPEQPGNQIYQTVSSHPIVSHSIWINDGAGNFTEESATRWDVGDYSGEILRGLDSKLLDVDYDGDLDFVALRRDNQFDIKHFQLYLNNGAGVFAYQPDQSLFLAGGIEGYGNDLDVTDLDGDGTYDIWLGMAGQQVHPLINTYRAPDGLPADVPRNLQIASGEEGVTLSWQAPPFAATARYYKVYRSTAPGLARTDRELIKVIGEVHQDEVFNAPITKWTTTEYLNDPDVMLSGATNQISFIDRTAQAGITYYYSVVHMGTENTPSQPTAEVSASVPAETGVDQTPPFLSIIKPTTEEWSQHPEIVLQYADGESGIDLSSLVVSIDQPIGDIGSANFLTAGTNLSDQFQFKNEQIFIAPFTSNMTIPTGNVTLTVRIADLAGNLSSQQVTFNVDVLTDQAPTAVITVNPQIAPLTVALSAEGSSDAEGAIMRHKWYFPDGSTAQGSTATWTAPIAGDHRVELVVWDDRGGVDQIETLVNVQLNADLNADGFVDGGDFLTWQRGFGITNGASLGNGDANGDGVVNTSDLGIWQSELGFRVTSADLNADGDVDGGDFLAWQRGFGITSGASLGDGDANGDGAVNAIDLGIWKSEFGSIRDSESSSTVVYTANYATSNTMTVPTLAPAPKDSSLQDAALARWLIDSDSAQKREFSRKSVQVLEDPLITPNYQPAPSSTYQIDRPVYQDLRQTVDNQENLDHLKIAQFFDRLETDPFATRLDSNL